jgi:pimeloyl-ACP methyl ester carboxylesterase
MIFFRNLIKKIIFFIIWLLLLGSFNSCASAQVSYTINEKEFTENSVYYQGEDTIKYLINKSGFDRKKPTIIYFNGSYPTPLIWEWEDGYLSMPPFTYFPFDEILNSFNLVLVSKPFTPVYSKQVDLVNTCYVPNVNFPKCFDIRFIKSNNLNYLGERGSFIIDYVKDKFFTDSNRLVLVGHSQGGEEVARIASLNSKVTDLVMINASPFGRIQQIATENYIDYLLGKKNFNQFQESRDWILKTLIDAKENKNDLSCLADSDENVLSFSMHGFLDLVNTKANVFYVTGSKDISSFYADQLLFDALLRGKSNITIKLFENVEHSLFFVEPNGEINYEIDRWHETFNLIASWIINSTK